MGLRLRGRPLPVGRYHSLLPMHLQDVLRNAVGGSACGNGDEARFVDPVYVGQLDEAIRSVKSRFPQGFR